MSDHDNETQDLSRRRFLQLTGITAIGLPLSGIGADAGKKISIVIDPSDSVADKAPVKWAVKELEDALVSRSVTVQHCRQLSEANAENFCLVIASAASAGGETILKQSGVTIPDTSESQGLVPARLSGRQVLLASGHDERGLIYALLELADRVRHGVNPLTVLQMTKPVIEQPFNRVRSINRLFVSDVEDKPWFNDREMWPRYLTHLTTQRFNRFNLSLGIGYDFLRNVTDTYFVFAYPFLLSVPGYDVRVPQLADAERNSNLQMLQFISNETVSRGLQFQLGLWMHGYEWINSPSPNYTIEGLSSVNHGAYCRDAVRLLLQSCPAISGITFRVHGESGVNEGSYEFWKMVFDGVKTCGRVVEIDMHSKGMDQTMIDAALATGLPITISPKYWAEHMGMPYHQADIRNLEVPKPDKKTSVLMNLSEGSRSFTRYGYGDLLKEDRQYKIVHRIWPGTQRLLLWGDPVTAAAHSRAFSFCGSNGVELMEPLSFKGRRGSGIAGDRCGYSDSTLKPRWDWEKFAYTLRVFGRLAYNPDADADVWRRNLRNDFASVSPSVESALAAATRILPIVLTTHGTSAGNNTYWPEMYTNQPIMEESGKQPYTDTPSPKVFGNVSPMDPQVFLSINEYVDELITGNTSGKYNPVEVAQWLEDYAGDAALQLKKAVANTRNGGNAVFKRMKHDVYILSGLGRFFSAKLRSGVLYGIYQRSTERKALEESLRYYKLAQGYWSDLAHYASAVYKKDLTVGERLHLRGHWLDRLPAIDEEVAKMSDTLQQLKERADSATPEVQIAIQKAIGKPKRALRAIKHTSPASFTKGEAVQVELVLDSVPGPSKIYYRHVNHAERWQVAALTGNDKRLTATIPAEYTSTAYPLQYYFEIRETPVSCCLYPGFNRELTSQPYFVIRQRGAVI